MRVSRENMPHIYGYLGYASQEGKYVVSYFTRGNVMKIGSWGYVQYDIHKATSEKSSKGTQDLWSSLEIILGIRTRVGLIQQSRVP